MRNFSLASGELTFYETKQITNFWTDEEDNRLKRLYSNHTNAELAELFNRTPKAIAARAYNLRLKKDENWKYNQTKKGQFKKGHVSYNKGLKGIHLSPETEFKPGNQPKNTKFDGAISIRYERINGQRKPYYYIRLAKAKWKPLHRHIWEQIKGKIPKTHVVRFIDGNTLNVDINNLMCISMAQNIQLNKKRLTNYDNTYQRSEGV
jgi:hypothetical protein